MEITIVSKKVGQPVVFEKMEHSLENMQEKVGGYIERVIIRDDIDMWIDEEGLLKENPKLNIITYVDGQEIHHIMGDIFFASHDEDGNTIGLNDEQMVWVANSLQIVGKTKTGDEDYFVFGFFVK